VTTWLIPPGVIVPYAGNSGVLSHGTVPSGWAYCDGSPISGNKSEYAALFTVIGTSWGGGAGGAGDFNLPDLRGYFLRGVNDGAVEGNTLRDPGANSRMPPAPSGAIYPGNGGDNVGSVEAGALQSFTAGFPVQYSSATGGGHVTFGYDMNNVVGGLVDDPSGWVTHPVTFSGPETRPINIYVYYLICLGIPSGSGASPR